MYAGDNPVNEVDPSGQLGFSLVLAGWIPIGVAIQFSSGDLAALSTPNGTLVAGLVGGAVTALLALINPQLAFVGGLLVAFILANGQSIANACPGGAIVVYLFSTGEPFYFCA